MSYDLRRGLSALGAEEHAAADPLPVDTLRTRAHRRRTVRAAATTGATLAVVAALTVAAIALPSSDPLPPAHTPTPTTPAPEPAPEPLPEWAPGTTFDGAAPACGEPVPDLIDTGVGADAGRTPITVTVDEPELSGRWTGSVTVPVTVTGPVDEPMWSRGPALLIVRDGVVVGGAAAEGTGFVYGTEDGALTWPDTVLALTDCAGDPLPVGEYALYPVAELARIDPVTLDFDPDTLTVVGEAVTLTVQPLDRAGLDALIDRDGPERLVVTTAGIGPLTVGLPPETNPGRAMIYPVPGYCRELRESYGEPYDPVYDGTDWFPVGYDSTGDGRELPFAVAAGGRVERIDVQSDRLATSGGIRLGSTLAELRAAHPEAVGSGAGFLTETWTIQDERGTLVFEVIAWDESADGDGAALDEPVVIGIRIYSRDRDEWAGAIYGSGDVVYNCFGT